MTFIFYCLAVGILALAYEQPDLFFAVAVLLVAKPVLWRGRYR